MIQRPGIGWDDPSRCGGRSLALTNSARSEVLPSDRSGRTGLEPSGKWRAIVCDEDGIGRSKLVWNAAYAEWDTLYKSRSGLPEFATSSITRASPRGGEVLKLDSGGTRGDALSLKSR